MTENQNPEQKARDNIDALLRQAGWVIQSARKIDLNAGLGQAVREYQTDVGPADYVLFVDRKPVGVIEAKRAEEAQRLTAHEPQTEAYAAAKLKWVKNHELLPFLYESTGVITRFTDGRDPKPRSRETFCFHRPGTFKEWLAQGVSLRERLQHIPPLNPDGRPAAELRLRGCQETAIVNLEASFKDNRPRALIQMATGAGKTYTAITSIYRLLKHANAKRVLFLVDTRNLGEQAEQEMMSYVPLDDNRKFTELYTVQRLKSSFVATDSQVCISTIQRLYSILKGTELDEAAEEINPAELETAEELAELPKLPEGWAWVRVGEIADVQLGRQRSPSNRSNNFPTKYIRAGNLTDRGLNLNDILDMEFEPQERERFLLKVGDVLLSEASGSAEQVGKPVVWRGEIEECCFQNTVIRVRSLDELCEYLFWIFKTYYISGVFRKLSRGVGINHLSAGKLENMAIPLVAIFESKKILELINEKLSLIENLDQTTIISLQQAEALRQSILKKAFSGELVPQDPNDEPASALLARIKEEKLTSSGNKKARA